MKKPFSKLFGLKNKDDIIGHLKKIAIVMLNPFKLNVLTYQPLSTKTGV